MLETESAPSVNLENADATGVPELAIDKDRIDTAAVKAYWAQRLFGAPTLLELPTDRPRPATQTYRGGSVSECFPDDLTTSIRQFCRQQGVGTDVAALCAFTILLARYSNQEDIVVGCRMSGPKSSGHDLLPVPSDNPLPLRTDLSGDPTVRELLARVRNVLMSAREHESISSHCLTADLQIDHNPSYAPIAQVGYAYLGRSVDLPTATAPFAGSECDRPASLHLDVMMTVIDGSSVTVDLNYNTELFDAVTMHRMLGSFRTLLAGMSADVAQRVSRLPILTCSERGTILEKWNATESDYPTRCVHTLFEDQVERTPNAAALEFEGERLTYRQLDGRANQLARYLRRFGVGPGVLVGLCLDRSIEMVVGLLATLKAGGAYVPLDPTWPPGRLGLIALNSRTGIVVGHSDLSDIVPPAIQCRIWIDQESEAIQRESEDSLNIPVDQAELAYVLHTSGSTGIPKGVQIEHRALVNFLVSMSLRPGIRSNDVLVAVTTISFDIAGLELFLPLIAGACVVVANRLETLDPVRLVELQTRCGATMMQATPATWRMLQASGWQGSPTLKVLCGGEALSAELARYLVDRCGSLWNLYGPTETTVWSTLQPIVAVDGTIHLGRPIANTTVFVLDGALQPVPIGVPGELFIGGDGLARGYLNRPDLTAERFVPDPYGLEPGARLYRTGDLVKYLADGTLAFLGRLDHQVKIRGHRIELGEIEGALRRHPAVQDAIVTAREDEPGQTLLVAYFVAADHSSADADLLEYLGKQLPEYMHPSRFVRLQAFPLSPNGKVDRKALPAPGLERSATAVNVVEPIGAIEATLCSLWEQILRIRPIGVTDSFRELGGTSLAAATMFRRIQEMFDRTIPISTLIQAPTIRQLAALLRRDESTESVPSLVPIKPTGSRRPFYCVHGAGANLLDITRMAAYVHEEQPFYGLQSQGLDGKREPLRTIEEMAAHYIEEIRRVQLRGPYLIGGLSLGGVIAFEMAQQLHRMGENAALVALLDTNFPRRERALPHHHWRFQHTIYPVVEGLEQFVMARRRSGLGACMRAWFTDIRSSLALRIRKMRDPAISRYPDAWVDLPPTLVKVWAANQHSEELYLPKTYPGRVTLFWATDWSISQLLHWPDRRLDWSEVTTGGLEVYSVPGDHANMRYEPHVGTLVRELNRSIERAHRSIESTDADG